MIDPLANIRDYLISQGVLTDLVADRIYAATDTENLPPLYTPNDGPCVAFKVRGGGLDYTSSIIQPSVQFQCVGIDTVIVYQVDGILHDVLQDRKTQFFKMARREVLGTLLYTSPPTLWPYVLTFFNFKIGNYLEV